MSNTGPSEPFHKVGYEAAMSILRFPKEIQSEIFTFAHRDNSNDEPLLLPVEVILSHVCSEWRNIVINLPILWTAFRFETRRCAYAPVDKLEEYLTRSKTHLLEFYFDIFAADHYQAKQRFELVEIAIAHASRWRRFTLFTDPIDAPTVKVINDLKRLRAPNLEYFTMCLASTSLFGRIEPQDISPSVLTGGAPKLSVTRIDTTSHFHSLPPLSNITTLTIQDSPGTQEFFYESFETFCSILTIPALENLSIESSLSFDTSSWDSRETHPRIIMPSLKTLRITKDYNIISILSLLDAPLLETLVLHDLELIALLDIGPDIHAITPFKKLDTIALFDCRFDVRDDDIESEHYRPLDSVDIILYELISRATRIVISSPEAPSLIECGSNILNFDKREWPRLQSITFDLATLDVMNCVKHFGKLPRSLTVRVVESVLDEWSGIDPENLEGLEEVCTVETMEEGERLVMDGYWPAPGGIFHEDGNLDVRWGEIIRARGPFEEASSEEDEDL